MEKRIAFNNLYLINNKVRASFNDEVLFLFWCKFIFLHLWAISCLFEILIYHSLAQVKYVNKNKIIPVIPTSIIERRMSSTGKLDFCWFIFFPLNVMTVNDVGDNGFLKMKH